MTSPLALPRVQLVVRRYVLRAPEGATLPAFAGATIRGAVGRALRGLVCATRMPVCEGCPVRSACAYAALHDGYTPPDVHSGTGLHAPPPLWLRDVEPGRELEAGGTLRFAMAAFGSATRSLPFVDESVRLLARTGIGRGRHPLELVAAEDEARAELGTLIDDRVSALRSALQGSGGSLRVVLRTPVAIRLKGPRWADPARPQPSWPERLVGGAARRLRALERRWLEVPSGEAAATARAIDDARELTMVDDQVRFERVRRYSFSEGRAVEFHGAVGSLRLAGGLDRGLPWLVAGELLSLGSGTTFGFGRIELGVG